MPGHVLLKYVSKLAYKPIGVLADLVVVVISFNFEIAESLAISRAETGVFRLVGIYEYPAYNNAFTVKHTINVALKYYYCLLAVYSI